MSRRIRVTAKRRREVDLDKLVFALLQILESEHAANRREQPPPRPMEGGESPSDEESAA